MRTAGQRIDAGCEARPAATGTSNAAEPCGMQRLVRNDPASTARPQTVPARTRHVRERADAQLRGVNLQGGQSEAGSGRQVPGRRARQ